ncbi:hypothetical protein WAI453_009657 [Rhynchosporium graminicola]
MSALPEWNKISASNRNCCPESRPVADRDQHMERNGGMIRNGKGHRTTDSPVLPPLLVIRSETSSPTLWFDGLFGAGRMGSGSAICSSVNGLKILEAALGTISEQGKIYSIVDGKLQAMSDGRALRAVVLTCFGRSLCV